MKYLFKIIVTLMLVILGITHKQLIQYIGFASTNEAVITEMNAETDIAEKVEDSFESAKTEQATVASSETDTAKEVKQTVGDYLVNDSFYWWDPIQLNWVAVKNSKKVLEQTPTPTFTSHTIITSTTKPIIINWKLLMDIEFKLDYYEAYEMEIETPVFTAAVKEIDGKEVIIKGYIIPIDESGKQIVLSANPYSSCFFCGNASPASIIGMNLKKKGHYKMDASIKFKGILRLNYDDPEEFYYVLDNAVPVK